MQLTHIVGVGVKNGDDGTLELPNRTGKEFKNGLEIGHVSPRKAKRILMRKN